MRYKNLGFSCLFLFITMTSFSQTKQYLYYLDKDLMPTNPANAIFTGIGIFENGLLKLIIYNTSNKRLVLTEHFTDSTLQLREGLFQSYYKNVSIQLEGNYFKDKEEGLWQRWDSLGNIIDSSVYNNGEKIMEVHFGYHKNGILESFIVNNIKADRLQQTYYDDTGNVLREVRFTGQKGVETGYNNGVIVRTDSLFTRSEIEASFRGGASAWNQYIMDKIQRHASELRNNEFGTCEVKFSIDTDGKIRNVEAITMRGTKLAEIVEGAIVNAPKWKPALQYGRPVRAYRIQPFTITDPN